MAGKSSSSSGPAPVHTLKSLAFTAQVLDSAGKPMRFYSVREEDNLVQACVEAKDGEQFSIRLDTTDRSSNYSAKLQLGGQHISSTFVKPSYWPVAIKDRRISETEGQRLMFSKAAVTDDDKDSIRDPIAVTGLGEITIIIRKVLSTLLKGKRTYPKSQHIGPQKAIYEKAKKVGAIQFGAGPTVNKPRTNSVKPTHDDRFVPIEFKIQCATRIGLQLLGHIPKDKERQPTKTAVRRRRSGGEEEEKNDGDEDQEDEDDEDEEEEEEEEEEKEEKQESRRSKKGGATEKKRFKKKVEERLAAREKRLVRELEELKLARLEREIEEVREAMQARKARKARKRRRADSEEASPGPHDSSLQTDGICSSLKKEGMRSNLRRRTMKRQSRHEPIDITYMSD
ncbi:hypothetical protein A4X03_0g4738 [Tilletia caries]|uniref:Uncharacterized protein n=1 Tax=Tilletia caries TaxID=13290 RepID=A0A8T8T8Y2_9BASI|nr:hypothetical protein A4X03_0g4738 [Tilletia caries]